MSVRYLLPCECGTPLVIQASQAGQQLSCSCGRTLTVPGLREIRQLAKTDSDAAAPSKASRDHHSPSGISVPRAIFAMSAAVTFLALAFTAFIAFQRSRLVLGPPPEVLRAQEDQVIDDLTVDQTWDAWMEMRAVGLMPQVPTVFMANRVLHKQATKLLFNGLIVAAIAGTLALVMVVIDSNTARTRR